MKYSKKIRKTVIYIISFIFIFLIALSVYSDKLEEKYPDYSSYSSAKNGVKALYLLTQKMTFDVQHYERSARFLPDKVIMVAVKPNITLLNDTLERKYLKQWMEKGNTVIIIDNNSAFNTYKLEEFSKELPQSLDISINNGVFRVGEGQLIFIERPDDFTNEGLLSLEAGVALINVLDKLENKKIVFNEYYHGIGKGITLWDLLGQTGILITTQIFIALILFMLTKAKRFGEPVTVFEIIKRKENENLYATSKLFMKAKANSLVLEEYFNNFRNQLVKYLGLISVLDDNEIIIAASRNRTFADFKLKRLFSECNEYITQNKKNMKQLLRLVSELEKIRKEITQ